MKRIRLILVLLPVFVATLAGASRKPLPWQTEFIDLSIELDPARGTLNADARLQLAHPCPAGSDIQLDLNPELAVKSVEDEAGLPIPFEHRDGALLLRLAEAHPAPGSRRVRIRYQGSFQACVPELEMHNAWVGPQVSYAFCSSRWYPQSPWPFRRCRGRISFLVPPDWIVAGPGRLTQVETLPEAKRIVFTVFQPVEFSFAAAAFAHQRQAVDGVEVGVYLLSGGREKIDFYLEHCAALIRFFREWYGFSPYEEYAVIEIPSEMLGMAGACSYEGLTFYPSENLPDRFFYPTVFAHEFGHSWWGNYVHGAEGAVINEGLAQMSMGLYIERAFGSEFFWNLLNNGLPEFRYLHSARLFFRSLQSPRNRSRTLESLLLRGEDLELGRPANGKFITLHMLANCKGFFVYVMLRELIGPEAFQQGLRGALKNFAWMDMNLDELRGEFEKASGRRLKWFFDQWFLRRGAPEFALSASVMPQRTNWLVRGIISQRRDIYRVNAEIEFSKGARRETRNIEIKGRKTTFVFALPFNPRALRFDPQGKILRWTKPM